MKNQYFGDLNDYRKYSLLRHLVGPGELDVAICWALTEDDGRTDGRRTQYLLRPEQWKWYDPPLFDHLRHHVVVRGARSVRSIQACKLLPKVRFFNDRIDDNSESRDSYFRRFFRFASGADLIFFDPDNGIGVKSVPRGTKRSSKYIYGSEISAAYAAGHSVLIYQHFPRRPRRAFLDELAGALWTVPGVERVISFTTPYVAFILLPQTCHLSALLRNSRTALDMWDGQIGMVNHHGLRGPPGDAWRLTNSGLHAAS